MARREHEPKKPEPVRQRPVTAGKIEQWVSKAPVSQNIRNAALAWLTRLFAGSATGITVGMVTKALGWSLAKAIASGAVGG